MLYYRLMKAVFIMLLFSAQYICSADFNGDTKNVQESSMNGIKQTDREWMISCSNLIINISKETGTLSSLIIKGDKHFTWTSHQGDVTVRDDLLRKTFDSRDLQEVGFLRKSDSLQIKKLFKGAPWILVENYSTEPDAIHWTAELFLENGDYRSSAISYNVPWPQPLYPVSFWAAKENMPSAPHRFAGISLEYGEITSGITIPALSSYLEKENAGLLIAMPFDFKTPRFRFLSSYREPDLKTEFDWLALSTGRKASASLLLRGTVGHWRPALGWLYERFKEYFEPRSKIVDQLWGGHVCGRVHLKESNAQSMAKLALKWYEVHLHFPYYGNYNPESSEWYFIEDETKQAITPETMRKTIRILHANGVKAMPYIQVTGDGDDRFLDPEFEGSRIRNCYGDTISAWKQTHLLNSDTSLPFGKDISRQIDGIVSRYPEIDGVFVDQACYNFADTAHDDGITAINNKPCFMTGQNYSSHLEHLSSLLHPDKAIIANGPFSIGVMKYFDAFMAESSGWLCSHLQYYGLAKPMFFLVYDTSDRSVEQMFQQCLVYGAGFTSYGEAAASKDLYDKYVPILERMFGRHWVFDPDPLQLPSGVEGGIFRSRNGTLLVSMVNKQQRLPGRPLNSFSMRVKTNDIEKARKVSLQEPGKETVEIPFEMKDGSLCFSVPGDTVAALAEISF